MSARPMPTQETETSAARRFIADIRQLHTDEPDVDRRWEKMGSLLSELLADPSVKAQSEKWPDCDQGGLTPPEGAQRAQNLLLYEDPDHGFVINGLVKAPGTRTSIHDHAHNWTLYGVLDGRETIERYERLDDGSKPDYAEIRKTENAEVGPGKIDLVRPWQIHAEQSGEDRTVAIIVRAEKPGSFLQGRYDPETCKYWQGYGPTQIPFEFE